jgi:hypothetical protein
MASIRRILKILARSLDRQSMWYQRLRHDDRRDRRRPFGMRGDRDGASVSGYGVYQALATFGFLLFHWRLNLNTGRRS